MIHQVLLVSAGFFHPPLRGRLALHETLQTVPGCLFEQVNSLEKLPDDLERFSALVLHYHHKRLSPAALARLDEFVYEGGGVLAIHAATASFKESEGYAEILGGRFLSHEKVERFVARRVANDVFAGLDDFSVKDELYLHELKPDVDVHFLVKRNGDTVPVVWTRSYGRGRVCYAMPGHTTESMKNPAYQAVLRRGLEWVLE